MMKGFKNYICERSRSRAFFTVLLLYVLFCISSSIYWMIDLQVRNMCMSLAFTCLAPLILLVEYKMRFRLGVLFTVGVLFIAVGAILGTCFDFYMLIPFFDTILHGMSGVMFCCLGFTLAEKFFGKAKDKMGFFGCAAFSFCFSLAIAVVWEIFEYGCTAFLGFDMMEDTVVGSINSYLLAGNHAEPVILDGITQTVIHYGNNQTYTINGYLELGLIDTLSDMIICTVGALLFAVISTLSYRYFPKINESIIPRMTEENL